MRARSPGRLRRPRRAAPDPRLRAARDRRARAGGDAGGGRRRASAGGSSGGGGNSPPGAPPSGVGNISIRYLGIPASGVVTTAYRTVTEFTATAGQTTFTPPSYTVGFINVYRNGVRLGASDFTASNGTTVVLAAGANSGDLVTTESFYISSVLNAIPNVPASVGISNLSATGTASSSTFLRGDNTWASISSGGMTLLGTLTTTSGVTQTLSGLTLTNYKYLFFIFFYLSCLLTFFL